MLKEPCLKFQNLQHKFGCFPKIHQFWYPSLNLKWASRAVQALSPNFGTFIINGLSGFPTWNQKHEKYLFHDIHCSPWLFRLVSIDYRRGPLQSEMTESNRMTTMLYSVGGVLITILLIVLVIMTRRNVPKVASRPPHCSYSCTLYNSFLTASVRLAP